MPPVDLSQLDPKPQGFGSCGPCAYRDVGSAAICFACASQQVELVGHGHCPTCEQHLPPSGTCSNYWCRRPVDVRFFDFVYAIAMRSGLLQTAINRYKYKNGTGWASIFGRVLVGYLDDRPQIMEGWDAIIASPTFIGPGSRRQWDHVGLVLERARVEAADRWPIHTQPALIVKTKETPQLVSLGLSERRTVSETELRESLTIPDPTAVSGRSFLVFDDVFTDGCTLREVARALKLAGASYVAGIVLARQPWQQ